MMASALLSGAPPARRGAGHPRPDGKAEEQPIVELSAATTTPTAGMRGPASRGPSVRGLLSGGEDEADVVPAEAERVVQRGHRLTAVRLEIPWLGGDVDTGVVGVVEVDGGRGDRLPQREDGGDRL